MSSTLLQCDETRQATNAQVDIEKSAQVSHTNSDGRDTHAQMNGDLRVTADPSGAKDLKLAKDGQTVLIPQPSDDPNDVLNWPSGKKYRVLMSLVFASLVCVIV